MNGLITSARDILVAMAMGGVAASAAAQPPPSPAPTPPPVHGTDPFGPRPGASPSPAPSPTPPPVIIQTAPSFSIYLDQDSVLPWIAPWGGDQNYTMGLGFQVTGDWVKRSFLGRPIDWVDTLSGLGRRHNRRMLDTTRSPAETYAVTLAQSAFTPRRLDISEPILDDRPYSSLLGFTFSRITVDGIARRALRTDLTVGMLGLHIGEYVQTRIHTARRKKNQEKDPTAVTPFDPAGWDHQISNGGEPTAKYTVTLTDELERSRWHDFSVQGEASLGYYTNAAIGPIFRVGKRRTGPWALANNPLNALNQALFELDARSPGRWEAYVWAAGRARLVAYNALMQGAFRHSDVTFDQTEVVPLVREFEAGATGGWRGWQVTLAIARRSPEFDVDSDPRSHTWGGIYLTKRWERERR
jgi:hypothetical protein